MFDPTISLGSILTIVGFLAGGWAFVLAMRSRIDVLTVEIQMLKDKSVQQGDQLIEFAKALVLLARQEERLTAMDRRVEDMRHGRGFVIAQEFDTPSGRG
jgi:hypothetical protein